jgi:hypothetical protein
LYASEELRRTKIIILIAVSKNGGAYYHSLIKNGRDINITSVKKDYTLFNRFPEK